jgi:type IX secretion system PorP/SprF family membrane protein
MKKTLFIIITTLSALNAAGQTHPGLENYLFNPVSVSPSYAGRQSGSLSFSHDQQLIGLKGAPVTTNVSYDSMTKGRFGFNVAVMENSVGPIQNTSFSMTTAYHLRISESEYFSVGIRYSLNQLGIDLVNEQYIDPDDFVIVNGIIQKWYQNIDLGGAYYGEKKYAGVSIRNVVRTSFFINDNYGARVIHLFGGGEYSVNENFDLLYSSLVNISENAPIDLNIHLLTRINGSLSSGILVSPNKIGLIYQVNSQSGFNFLYQYAYPLTQIRYVSQQSHTACIRFHFVRAKSYGNRIVESPVFFL